jgi:hypothetical protein
MEIVPGEGVALTKIGEHSVNVENRIGTPVHAGRSSRAVYDTSPCPILTYTPLRRLSKLSNARIPAGLVRRCSSTGAADVLFPRRGRV